VPVARRRDGLKKAIAREVAINFIKKLLFERFQDKLDNYK